MKVMGPTQGYWLLYRVAVHTQQGYNGRCGRMRRYLNHEPHFRTHNTMSQGRRNEKQESRLPHCHLQRCCQGCEVQKCFACQSAAGDDYLNELVDPLFSKEIGLGNVMHRRRLDTLYRVLLSSVLRISD